MKTECPKCSNQCIDFLKIWACGPYMPFRCSDCHANLAVKKIGPFFWKHSSFLLGLPCGILLGVMIGLQIFNKFFISLLIITTISACIADYLSDKYQYQTGKMIVEIKKSKHNNRLKLT